jgi:hypothetical protein
MPASSTSEGHLAPAALAAYGLTGNAGLLSLILRTKTRILLRLKGRGIPRDGQ